MQKCSGLRCNNKQKWEKQRKQRNRLKDNESDMARSRDKANTGLKVNVTG